MFQILDSNLLCILRACYAPTLASICAFGENKQPHWIIRHLALRELVETVLEAGLVLFPSPREEDESIEDHALAHHRNIF